MAMTLYFYIIQSVTIKYSKMLKMSAADYVFAEIQRRFGFGNVKGRASRNKTAKSWENIIYEEEHYDKDIYSRGRQSRIQQPC